MEPAGGGGDAEVGESSADAGAFEHVRSQHGSDRDSRLVQRDVRRQQQRVDAREHADPRRIDARFVEPTAHDGDKCHGAVVGTVTLHSQGASRRVAVRAGLDLLDDAAVVVAEQRPGAGDDLDRTAVVHVQRVLRGCREQTPVVNEESGIRAGVPVDALIVVTHAEHVERRQGEEADQQDVRRCEVLELVDENVAARPLQRPPELAVAQQGLDGCVDLLVEVHDATLGELETERREQLGESRDIVPRRLDLVRVAQTETDRRQPLDVRADRIGVRTARASAGHQRLDDAAHLALVDDRRRRPSVLRQHPQAERVQRPDVRAEVGGARLHLQLSLLVVRDRDDRARLDATVAVQVAHPLGEHPRLAGASGRDHPRRAGPVAHCGELVDR